MEKYGSSIPQPLVRTGENIASKTSVFGYNGEHRDYFESLRDYFFDIPPDARRQIEDRYEAIHRDYSHCLSPEVEAAVEAHRWLVLGEDNSQLPELMRVRESDGHMIPGEVMVVGDRTVLDVTYSINSGSEDKVSSILREINEIRRQSSDSFEDNARALLYGYLHGHSRAVSLIKSFEQPPVVANEEIPLTAYWHQVRTAQTEALVRKKYGITAGNELAPGTEPRQELERKLAKIDDETTIAPNNDQQDTTGVDRFMSYIASTVYQIMQENDEDVRSLNPPNNLSWDNMTTRFSYAREIESHIDQLLERVLPGAESRRTLHKVESIDTRLLAEVIRNLFGSCIFKRVPLAVKLEESKKYVVGLTASVLRSSRGEYFDPPALTTVAYFREATYGINSLEQKPTANFGKRDMGAVALGGAIDWDHAPALHSRNEVGELEAVQIGEIKRLRHEKYPVMSRLIVPTEADQPQVREVHYESGADILLTMQDSDDNWRIPGYVLASRYGDQSQYVYDEENEPYMPCGVPVTFEQTQTLAWRFAAIGLNVAPFLYAVQKDMSVAGLTAGLKTMGDYSFADDGGGNLGGLQEQFDTDWRVVENRSIESFAPLVKDGRLQLQCTGAAALLKCALDSLFDEQSSRVVGGYVMQRDNDKIDAAGHVQVEFTAPDGVVYMLDATPYEQGKRGIRNAFREAVASTGLLEPLRRGADSVAHKIMELAAAITTSEPEGAEQIIWEEKPSVIDEFHAAVVLPEKTADEKVADLLGSLERALQGIRGDANLTELHEGLVKLPDHDPMRITLQAIMANERGIRPEAEVQRTLEYLKRCRAASSETRKAVKIDHYADDLLDMLIANLDSYAKLRTPV